MYWTFYVCVYFALPTSWSACYGFFHSYCCWKSDRREDEAWPIFPGDGSGNVLFFETEATNQMCRILHFSLSFLFFPFFFKLLSAAFPHCCYDPASSLTSVQKVVCWRFCKYSSDVELQNLPQKKNVHKAYTREVHHGPGDDTIVFL